MQEGHSDDNKCGNEYDSTIEGNNMTIGMEVDIDCSPTTNEVDEGAKKEEKAIPSVFSHLKKRLRTEKITTTTTNAI